MLTDIHMCVLPLRNCDFTANKCKIICSFSSRWNFTSNKQTNRRKTRRWQGQKCQERTSQPAKEAPPALVLMPVHISTVSTASQVEFCYCNPLQYHTVSAIALSNSLSASCLEQQQYCLPLQCNRGLIPSTIRVCSAYDGQGLHPNKIQKLCYTKAGLAQSDFQIAK